jgi:hypothetical protein
MIHLPTNSKLFTGIAFCLFIGQACRLHVNRMHKFSMSKLEYQQRSYLEKYGIAETKIDTIILQKNLERHYSNGKLFRIGKINKFTGIRIGEWFIFDETMELNYVIHYGRFRIDSLGRPTTINQKW